ncbi:MAG: lysophospholipid acyltransferase family protein [Candidatus Nanopelagicales bacterium]
MFKTLHQSLGPVYRSAQAVLWPTMMTMTKRDWRGAEYLGQPGQGIVVTPNHISHFDFAAMAHFLNDAGRPPRFLAKNELFDIAGLGILLRSAEQIPVKRGSDPAHALDAAIKAVREGECVCIYPEGTITRDPNLWPMKGKSGAVRVALASGAPVIPVAQWGAQAVLHPYSVRFRPIPRKTMLVVAGPPVDLDDLRDQPITRELLVEGTARVMARITAMLEELRGEKAPGEPLDWAAEQRRQQADNPRNHGVTGGSLADSQE